MPHLLLAEDDELLRDGLSAQLTHMGHTVTVASDGASAIHVIDTARFSAVILDLGLPQVDGMEVLKHIREEHPALPVLILTARDGVDDRVAGLNAGADDYLTKPFNWTELQARLSAMLRRAQLPAFDGGQHELAWQGLRVHLQEPRAWLEEPPGTQNIKELEITQREWSLLSLLVAQQARVTTREDVLSRWQLDGGSSGDTDAANNNALEVYIHRLRRKLEGSKLSIRNVRGLGYLLEAA
jgi:two-component system, OmpR family, response regulator